MKYVIANWKMKMSVDNIKSWYITFDELLKKLPSENLNILIAPSTIHIPIVAETFKNKSISLAAQDIAEFEKGPHTGYTGGFQIREFCEYILVGHSERKEPEELVKIKRDIALENRLIPIVCFTSVEDAKDRYKNGSMLAWEDPDNISQNGEYRAKDPKDIVKGCKVIGEQIPSESALIYGGSVNRDNIRDLKQIDRINGVLVGNASLDPEHFFEIIVKFTS